MSAMAEAVQHFHEVSLVHGAMFNEGRPEAERDEAMENVYGAAIEMLDAEMRTPEDAASALLFACRDMISDHNANKDIRHPLRLVRLKMVFRALNWIECRHNVKVTVGDLDD